MKLPTLLFLILLAIWVVIATVLVIGESPSVEVPAQKTGAAMRSIQGHGIPHPEFKSMQSGGPGAARHEGILWFGWAFGLLQIAFFVALISYGGQRDGRLGPLKIPILVGGFLYAATFTGMVYSYQGYMHEVAHPMFGSLPVPTAWMIYGVWPIPLVFMFLYMFTFDSWTFREADLARFEELLAEKQFAGGKDAGGDQT